MYVFLQNRSEGSDDLTDCRCIQRCPLRDDGLQIPHEDRALVKGTTHARALHCKSGGGIERERRQRLYWQEPPRWQRPDSFRRWWWAPSSTCIRALAPRSRTIGYLYSDARQGQPTERDSGDVRLQQVILKMWTNLGKSQFVHSTCISRGPSAPVFYRGAAFLGKAGQFILALSP